MEEETTIIVTNEFDSFDNGDMLKIMFHSDFFSATDKLAFGSGNKASSKIFSINNPTTASPQRRVILPHYSWDGYSTVGDSDFFFWAANKRWVLK
jgi:hypothetical protein